MEQQPFDTAASAATPTPRGRAVLCLWAAVPGLIAAPFLFWQGPGWGLLFCAVWAALVLAVRVRACSFVAALDARALRLYAGVAFPVQRIIPRGSVSSTLLLRTPLLRLAGASVLLVYTPGLTAVLPAIPCEAAEGLRAALLAGEDAL